jgi:hypothetical protein
MPPPPMPPAPPAPPYGAAPVGYAVAGPGPIGQIRPTGKTIFFFIITLGIYGWFWYYNVHSEMKAHRGDGLGGGLALVLGIFVSIVMAFLTPGEVGTLYKARGQAEPVSAMTGFWVLLPLVGGIVWFVKTNGALNDYWRSLGATD